MSCGRGVSDLISVLLPMCCSLLDVDGEDQEGITSPATSTTNDPRSAHAGALVNPLV